MENVSRPAEIKLEQPEVSRNEAEDSLHQILDIKPDPDTPSDDEFRANIQTCTTKQNSLSRKE